MKLNKKISKFLVLGMLTNNIYFNSSANSSIPNRYETLEGEYIAIDDSTEGNLEEIEIFGNTIQDDNNLEDIQSVGDLYVDENGNPILDKQGREQYKLDIISSNSNLNYNNKFYKKSTGTFSIVDNGYKVENKHNQVRLYYDIPLNGSTEVTVKAKLVEKSSSYNNSNAVLEWYIDGAWGYERIYFEDNELNYVISDSKITSNSKILTVDIAILKDDFNYGYAVFDDISIAYGDTTHLPFEEPLEYKTTILLPTQLQKVGDIADRLYWDNSKGRYIIEKNVGVITDFSNAVHHQEWSIENFIAFEILGSYIPNGNFWSSGDLFMNYIPNLQSTNSIRSKDKVIGISSYSRHINFKVNIEGVIDKDTLIEWVNNNNVKILYPQTPQIINTNITSKLKIPTYNNKTHIYVDSQNNINPTLKVTVDRLPQIAKNSVEEAENNSTSNNISLARMYVNMLPESLYKDQLQEQLSEVFSLDIALDRESASSNLDVYVKSQNMLSLSLDTNSVTFEGYSGTEPMEKLNAVNLTINSSLPYDFNAYIPSEISNADGTNIMDLDILNIKESSESVYQQFADTTNKVVLKSDCAKGNGNMHNIDLKLDSNAAHKADVYKTVIKFEAEQK